MKRLLILERLLNSSLRSQTSEFNFKRGNNLFHQIQLFELDLQLKYFPTDICVFIITHAKRFVYMKSADYMNQNTISTEIGRRASDELNEGSTYSYETSDKSRQIDLFSHLEKKTLQRGKERWSNIIEKYSKLDNHTKSDVVDINTGAVIENNGHLNSLTDEDVARSMNSLLNFSEEFRKITPQQRHLMIERLIKIQKPLSQPSTAEDHKSKLNSPVESPTKRQKRDTPMNSSPLKVDKLRDVFPILAQASSDVDLESPTKTKDKAASYFDEWSDYNESNSDSSDEYDAGNGHESRFEKNFQVALFLCPFPKCQFNNELKLVFRDHLLSEHAPELRQMGYPVATDLSSSHEHISIPDLCSMKLSLHFPLEWDLPLEPFLCRINLKQGPCKKVFLNREDLLEHQKNLSLCSSKTQVLLCPVLGCTYKTDQSYEAFRQHVNSHQKRSWLITDNVPQLMKPSVPDLTMPSQDRVDAGKSSKFAQLNFPAGSDSKVQFNNTHSMNDQRNFTRSVRSSYTIDRTHNEEPLSLEELFSD